MWWGIFGINNGKRAYVWIRHNMAGNVQRRYIVDITMSRADGQYFVKELSIMAADHHHGSGDGTPEVAHYIFRAPPRVRADRQSWYCTRRIHGLGFYDGKYPYSDLRKILRQYAFDGLDKPNGPVLLMKGAEKCGILRKLVGYDRNLRIFDMEMAKCPNFRELNNLFGQRVKPCDTHCKIAKRFIPACSKFKLGTLYEWYKSETGERDAQVRVEMEETLTA